jgi:7-carboxy-7-deazaguanine synthase
VLVETNGTCDLSILPADVIAIMDVKCPGSGAAGSTDWENVGRLRPRDEVKFVLADRSDYEWACEVVRRFDLVRACHAVLFSPVWSALEPRLLGQWILADRLGVRLQVQLHRVIGVP